VIAIDKPSGVGDNEVLHALFTTTGIRWFLGRVFSSLRIFRLQFCCCATKFCVTKIGTFDARARFDSQLRKWRRRISKMN
jgi:hypothetical protein